MTIRRIQAAALLLAAACAGCATEDYGYAREHRFDRPYRGGAADVPDSAPKPASTPVTTAQVLGAFAYVGLFVLACTGHADGNYSSTQPEPPPPPPPPSHP